jgi:hypothetical protein
MTQFLKTVESVPKDKMKQKTLFDFYPGLRNSKIPSSDPTNELIIRVDENVQEEEEEEVEKKSQRKIKRKKPISKKKPKKQTKKKSPKKIYEDEEVKVVITEEEEEEEEEEEKEKEEDVKVVVTESEEEFFTPPKKKQKTKSTEKKNETTPPPPENNDDDILNFSFDGFKMTPTLKPESDENLVLLKEMSKEKKKRDLAKLKESEIEESILNLSRNYHEEISQIQEEEKIEKVRMPRVDIKYVKTFQHPKQVKLKKKV